MGAEFQVNSYTTGIQFVPKVTMSPAGDFFIAWQSEGSTGSDTSMKSVQGQRYSDRIFADGFESGDTTSWSVTTP